MCFLRHVGITVQNMDKVVEFYKNVLNFRIVYDTIEYGEVISNFSNLENVKVHIIKMVDKKNNMIELLHYLSHPKSSFTNEINLINEIGCSHFAITVTNIEEVVEKVKDFGCEIIYPTQTSPSGKVKLTFIRDPDGTLVEIVEDINV